MRTYEGSFSGQGRRFAIVASRFNETIGRRLLDGALDALRRHGVADDDIAVAWVPGAFEIPLVAKRLAATGRYDGVICLGAVIRGATPHFWRADETYCRPNGTWASLYRAIDQDGQVVDVSCSERRNAAAAEAFLKHERVGWRDPDACHHGQGTVLLAGPVRRGP